MHISIHGCLYIHPTIKLLFLGKSFSTKVDSSFFNSQMAMLRFAQWRISGNYHWYLKILRFLTPKCQRYHWPIKLSKNFENKLMLTWKNENHFDLTSHQDWKKMYLYIYNLLQFAQYFETFWCFTKFSFHHKRNNAWLLQINMVYTSYLTSCQTT